MRIRSCTPSDLHHVVQADNYMVPLKILHLPLKERAGKVELGGAATPHPMVAEDDHAGSSLPCDGPVRKHAELHEQKGKIAQYDHESEDLQIAERKVPV